MGFGVLRLILLAVLSLGVIGMHTVGHSGDHGSLQTSDHADAVDPCDGDCGAAAPVTARLGSGSDPVHGGTGLVVMCLAVLAGLGILAVLASFLARRHRTLAKTSARRPARSPRAGPAQAFMFASRLVDVAVLRI